MRTQLASAPPWRRVGVILALGPAQILAWGTSYYLLAVLAKPISDDTGWPFVWVVGGVSLGLLAGGLAARTVGRVIEQRGGRPVLSASALLLAAGLAGLSVAPSLPLFLLAWLVIGVGMGAGLYDAAFATLGRLFGDTARSAITHLTLFGGFASTACWPLSAFLVANLGWRDTCLAYAAIHIAVVLPLYWFGVPRETEHPPIDMAATTSASTPGEPAPDARASGQRRRLFALLAVIMTTGSVISTILSVHLLTILQAREIALTAAVALGALVGPSQVGARVVEMLIGRHYHPIWTLAASTVLVASGVGILLAGLPLVAAGLMLYGAGIGIKSIAQGTLPLALFGAPGYAGLMGRLATPNLLAQSVSPGLSALLLAELGATVTLASLLALALLNVSLVAVLYAMIFPRAPRGV